MALRFWGQPGRDGLVVGGGAIDHRPGKTLRAVRHGGSGPERIVIQRSVQFQARLLKVPLILGRRGVDSREAGRSP